jgi:hypothetical protein
MVFMAVVQSRFDETRVVFFQLPCLFIFHGFLMLVGCARTEIAGQT